MNIVPLIFLLLVVFNYKQLVADWLLQTDYHQRKAARGWDFLGPLLSHVSNHFIFTTLISAGVLFYFDHPAPLGFGMLIGLGDGIVHFYFDRIKAGPKYMGRWKMRSGHQVLCCKEILAAKPGDRYFEPTFDQWCEYEEYLLKLDQRDARRALHGNRLFWWSLGFDQSVHHLTNYAAIYAVLKIAGAL